MASLPSLSLSLLFSTIYSINLKHILFLKNSWSTLLNMLSLISHKPFFILLLRFILCALYFIYCDLFLSGPHMASYLNVIIILIPVSSYSFTEHSSVQNQYLFFFFLFKRNNERCYHIFNLKIWVCSMKECFGEKKRHAWICMWLITCHSLLSNFLISWEGKKGAVFKFEDSIGPPRTHKKMSKSN